jgi:hypothetical protein
MLHFCDVPAGQVGSVFINIVHFCEQMLCPSVSNEFVHTPLAHSVDMSLAVVQVAPNGRLVALPLPIASTGGGGASEVQAANNTATAIIFNMAAP